MTDVCFYNFKKGFTKWFPLTVQMIRGTWLKSIWAFYFYILLCDVKDPIANDFSLCSPSPLACQNTSLICICVLTLRLQAFAQLRLGLPIGSESSLGVELVGHGGGGDHGLEATRALGHVLLRVEENHVDLGHVEQPEGHRGTETHRDGQRGRLNVHLQGKRTTGINTNTALYVAQSSWRTGSIVQVMSALCIRNSKTMKCKLILHQFFCSKSARVHPSKVTLFVQIMWQHSLKIFHMVRLFELIQRGESIPVSASLFPELR